MGFKLNLTQDEIKAAQNTAPPPLPAGIYGAVIYSAVEKKSKAKNDMYEIDFKITEGPAGIGRKGLKYWATIKPDALWSVVKVLKALDLPYPDKDTEPGEFEFPDAEDFVGEQVNIRLIVDEYLGVNDDGEEEVRYQNQVKDVRKYDPSKISDADDTEGSDPGKVFL